MTVMALDELRNAFARHRQLACRKQLSSAAWPLAKGDRVAKICFDLAQEGITPERWELEALACGATVIYGDKKFKYVAADGGTEFSMQK